MYKEMTYYHLKFSLIRHLVLTMDRCVLMGFHNVLIVSEKVHEISNYQLLLQ